MIGILMVWARIIFWLEPNLNKAYCGGSPTATGTSLGIVSMKARDHGTVMDWHCLTEGASRPFVLECLADLFFFF